MNRVASRLLYGATIGVFSLSTLSFGLNKAKANGDESSTIDDIQGYDAINGATGSTGSGSTVTGGSGTTGGDTGSTVGNFFKGYNPITNKQMQDGAYYASPFVNFFGTVIGFIMTIVVAWQAVQTAVDLLYWAIPPLRGFLSKQNPQPSGGISGVGMTGGYGMGMQQQQGIASKLPVFVSDDMLQAMEQGGTSGATSGGFGSGFGGMAMQNQQPKRSHVLMTYLKKRVLSLVVLGVCAVLLFSSVLMNTGINIGAFLIKVINLFNGVVVSNT